MLEYLNLCLICTLFAYLYIQMKTYLPLLKMAEEIFSDLQSDTKHQKLLKHVLIGNSKLYLGKVYTEDQLAKLNKEEVEKLFNNYEAKLSGQMMYSLGCSIIGMYSMRPCAALGITNQDAMSKDLENNPFLNSALQRATCGLYYRFSLFLMENEQVEQVKRETQQLRVAVMGPLGPGSHSDPKRELLSSIGLFIGTGLLDFWFGVGAALGSKMVNGLEELISSQ